MSLKNLLLRLTAKRRKAPLDSSRSTAGDHQAFDQSRDGQSAVYIGLDFGTSFSKVVLGGTADRYPQESAA